MIKIGILKETKTPIDNRVALSPDEIVALKERYPEAEFYVQQSDIRAFTDEEYAKRGIPVVETLENCDVMFGIKEAHVDSLLPNKHYIFFGHIAKMQPYNRPLIKKMIELGITFTDYLQKVRIEHSMCLLANTNRKIIDIAGVCGYSDMKSFNAVFKKIVGTTPQKFRRDFVV